MELLKLLVEMKIPDVAFFVVEVGILVFVIYEAIIGRLSYEILKRKRGRPRKSYAYRLMERLSKKLHMVGSSR